MSGWDQDNDLMEELAKEAAERLRATPARDARVEARRHAAVAFATEYAKEHGVPRSLGSTPGAAGREIVAIAREIETFMREG